MEVYKIFSGLGLALLFASYVFVVIQGLRVNLGWGLGNMFIPIVSFIFVFAHWKKAKYPLLVNILGIASFSLAIYLQPDATINQHT